MMPEAKKQAMALPGINWLKYLALVGLTIGAILSGILALTIYFVSQNAHTLAAENKRTADICVIVHALDPILKSARDQTQKAIDDGTYARLIAKGDLPPGDIDDRHEKRERLLGGSHHTPKPYL